MKDFDGVDVFEGVETEVDTFLNKIAPRYVVQLSSNKDKNIYICYAVNGKKFELTSKETDRIILKRAAKENVLAFKKHLAKKWLEELNDT